MQYEVGNELDLRNFDGVAFACLVLHEENQTSSGKRVFLLSRNHAIDSIPMHHKPGVVIIKEVHDLSAICSIKYSRGSYGRLILLFKSGASLLYKIKNASNCADTIVSYLDKLGIDGNLHKRSIFATEQVSKAEEILKKTKELEVQFSLSPSIQLIQELVDLLREAAERFDAASDERYDVAIKTIQKFLSRADVVNLLDKNDSANMPCVTLIDKQIIEKVLDERNKITPVVSEEIDDLDNSFYEEKTSGNNEKHIEELQAMLGDITDEFDKLIGSF